MAIVKVDMSEWEVMKDKERLLENSLEDQKKMALKIEELQKEKIVALESVAYKVVKIHKLLTKEVHRPLRDSAEAFIGLRRSFEYGLRSDHFHAETISEALFEKVITEKEELISTTNHGFDEVVLEIKEDYIKAQDAEITKKLADAKVLRKENIRLIEECQKLNRINREVTSQNTELMNDSKKDKRSIARLTFTTQALMSISRIIDNGYSFGVKGARLDEINEIIRKEEYNIHALNNKFSIEDLTEEPRPPKGQQITEGSDSVEDE